MYLFANAIKNLGRNKGRNMLIAAVCLVVGLGAGTVIAQPIADSMLESRVAEVEAAPEQNKALFIGGQS